MEIRCGMDSGSPSRPVVPVVCPVCQATPFDPPRGCEFCPESVVTNIDEIAEVIERLAAAERAVERVGGDAPGEAVEAAPERPRRGEGDRPPSRR